MFQSYSDYITEADDFYSQNSVPDIIAAHLKMLLLSFEKYYPQHEDPRRTTVGVSVVATVTPTVVLLGYNV